MANSSRNTRPLLAGQNAKLVSVLSVMVAVAWISVYYLMMNSMQGSMDWSAGSMGVMFVALDFRVLLLFLVVWVIGMVAMMFPAMIPVVSIYDATIGKSTSYPTISSLLFLTGYLAVYMALGLSAYLGVLLVIRLIAFVPQLSGYGVYCCRGSSGCDWRLSTDFIQGRVPQEVCFSVRVLPYTCKERIARSRVDGRGTRLLLRCLLLPLHDRDVRCCGHESACDGDAGDSDRFGKGDAEGRKMVQLAHSWRVHNLGSGDFVLSKHLHVHIEWHSGDCLVVAKLIEAKLPFALLAISSQLE